MEKYYNLYAITLAVGLAGCLTYTAVAAIKHGFENVKEKEIVAIFTDCLAICSALKIICLSFDRTICNVELGVDLMFLGFGGVVMLMACSKNILLKFRLLFMPVNCTEGNAPHK
jgi:hypothetical protein